MLGAGVAYGVDVLGDVIGQPVLWRNGAVLQLSNDSGSAYAIDNDGIIVGATIIGGFVADARDARPRAIQLDPLVVNLHGRHVIEASAFRTPDTFWRLWVRTAQNLLLTTSRS